MKSKNQSRPKEIKSQGGFNWDLTLKVLSGLIAIAGVVFGIYQYRHHRDQQRQLELSKRQVELCFKATNLAAQFTQATSPEDAEDLRKQFWTIYYGELSIVEEKNVEQAMKDFGGALERWERMNEPPSDFFPPSEFVFYKDSRNGQGITFKQLAYHLSQACKESL